MIKSVYIHIPFCTTICSYCDFPKLYHNQCFINRYLEALSFEIDKKYKGEVIDTIYVGGGTPTSLNIDELTKLFEIINKFKMNTKYEFTIECNLENLTEEKLKLFKKYNVNRLSIGIQTFNKKYLDYLNRKTCDTIIIDKAKKMGFNNINVDLIYAIPNQTLEELKDDLNKFLKLDINHISTYSLMIENNTMLGIKKIKPISDELDYQMYQEICNILKKNNFKHYEISNFCKNETYSKHNLNYWNNEEYYGFGMGASGYINNVRYTNTKSITKYINKDFYYEEEVLDQKSKIEYEMILGLRKIKGISLDTFKQKYHYSIDEYFDIKKLLEEGKLMFEDNHLKINENYLYTSNDILVNFVGEE